MTLAEELLLKALNEKEEKIREQQKSLQKCSWLMVVTFIFFGYLLIFNLSAYMEFAEDSFELIGARPDENMTLFAKNLTRGTYGIYSAEILSSWIANESNIQYASANPFQSARTTFYTQQGVCRQKAVLLTSFLSAIGVYSVTLAVEHGTHEIVKVWESPDGTYYYCDPTNGSPYSIDCVDYKDCGRAGYCNFLVGKCISEKSLGYCWYPV